MTREADTYCHGVGGRGRRLVARVGGPAMEEGEREAGSNVSGDRLGDGDRAVGSGAGGDEACASGVELVRAGV